MESSESKDQTEISRNDVIRLALASGNIAIEVEESSLVPWEIQIQGGDGKTQTIEFMGDPPVTQRKVFTETPPPPIVRPKWLDEPL